MSKEKLLKENFKEKVTSSFHCLLFFYRQNIVFTKLYPQLHTMLNRGPQSLKFPSKNNETSQPKKSLEFIPLSYKIT